LFKTIGTELSNGVLSESGVPFGIFEIVILVFFQLQAQNKIYIGGIKSGPYPLIEILSLGHYCLTQFRHLVRY
jgi:hypothetical protein